MRIFDSPALRAPQVNVLSNGRYQLVITNAGGGYSRWRDLAVTRWREDSTSDRWGSFIYLRDPATGEFWSTSYQPTLHPVERYEVVFTHTVAGFRQRHSGLEAQTQICVSPEDDVEVRRVTLTNHSRMQRSIELTSYAEVVLAVPGADAAHPVFSNLFVQTEFRQAGSAVLCNRRPRSEGEPAPWLLHLMVGEKGAEDAISFETDRVRFVGRGRTPANPAAMVNPSALSNTTGSVLDPIVSLRRTFGIPPEESVRIDFVLGVTESRDFALALVDKYRDPGTVDRTFDLPRNQGALGQIEATEAQLYDRLAGALIYVDPVRRAPADILAQNRRGQSGLWRYGISGDIPIVLLTIRNSAKVDLVKQLVQAHTYWRLKGLTVDLVVLTEEVSTSSQTLHDQIIDLIVSGRSAEMIDKRAGIFVRRLEQISGQDRVLLQSVARIVLTDERGLFAEHLDLVDQTDPLVPALTPGRSFSPDALQSVPPRELLFYNGLGGFTPDGGEYVITLQADQVTPAPWVNVLANPLFGTLISESGSAYTWAENSHEFRLTPWNNDPVTDSAGEFIYIRDEETGHFWSPTPLPARGAAPYVIRHGFGYSMFEHDEEGIISELTVYVAVDAPVKIVVLKLRNVSDRPRRISVTGYCEWVLGDSRERNMLHVQTELDRETGALLARNFYNGDFSERIAFLDVDDRARTVTGDRREFLGRNGTLSNPAALKRACLSGRVGAGLDPCGAVQAVFDLSAGKEQEIGFRLGAGRDLGEAQNLIRRFQGSHAARGALEAVQEYWKLTLSAVHVETPDPSVNLMTNGWLLYQILSCRLWGRTGFYQSGGAFGFRDQLQDSMALVHAEPALLREHLLRAASRQFQEGDVQHWWHPPSGRGVRTHVSDDYLWLPYVTCRYVSC
ncbi:MAG TPA: hypothetical protein VGH07_04765, partial [Chthoniobacterales bacterium]